MLGTNEPLIMWRVALEPGSPDTPWGTSNPGHLTESEEEKFKTVTDDSQIVLFHFVTRSQVGPGAPPEPEPVFCHGRSMLEFRSLPARDLERAVVTVRLARAVCAVLVALAVAAWHAASPDPLDAARAE